MKHTKEPCPYCLMDGGIKEIPALEGFNARILLFYTTMLINITEKMETRLAMIKINYCPMCGRKLEDVREGV